VEPRKKLGKPAIKFTQILALAVLVPALMGGCPGARNELVNGIETTLRGIIDAGLDQAFDAFRTDDLN
jgi:hypothetical protein